MVWIGCLFLSLKEILNTNITLHFTGKPIFDVLTRLPMTSFAIGQINHDNLRSFSIIQRQFTHDSSFFICGCKPNKPMNPDRTMRFAKTFCLCYEHLSSEQYVTHWVFLFTVLSTTYTVIFGSLHSCPSYENMQKSANIVATCAVFDKPFENHIQYTCTYTMCCQF